MPGNSVHAPACLILAASCVALPFVTSLTWFGAAQVAAGCCLGVIVSPDLDMVNTLRRVPVIGWLWGAWWWAYREAMPHRSRWSHAPGLGTLGRLFWLWPLWIALGLIGMPPWLVIAGLMGADLLHVCLDAFWPGAKR